VPPGVIFVVKQEIRYSRLLLHDAIVLSFKCVGISKCYCKIIKGVISY